MNLIKTAFLVAALGSWPAWTQPERPYKDSAAVYFYRYRQFVGAALTPSVYSDEQQVARMENGAYCVIRLTPGRHHFRSNDKQSGVELDLKPGEEYYLRVELVAGMLKGHGRLVVVPREQGAFETQKLRSMDDAKVHLPQ